MSRTPAHRSLILVAGLATAAAMALTGCSGHGKYTKEHINQAEERMATLKAGTQWDMARQQFFVGDLEKALRNVNESISLHEPVPKSHTLRGRILMEMGQLEAAAAAYGRALELNPEFIEAHYYYGVLYERFRDSAAALDKYLAAASLDPDDPQYLIAASEMLIDMGRLDEAEELLESKQEKFQYNAGVRQTLGHVALMRGKVAGAVELFGQARMLAPDELPLLEDLALAQVAAGKFAEAEFSLRTLLSRPEYTDRRDLKLAQSRCLMAMDRPVEARGLLLSLTSDERGRNDPQAWADLAEAAMLLGDTGRVRLAATRLLSVAPERPEGHLFTGVWKQENGDFAGALQALDRAANINGKDARVVMLRGLTLRKMGREREAAECFKQAIALDPSRESARRMLAVVNAGE